MLMLINKKIGSIIIILVAACLIIVMSKIEYSKGVSIAQKPEPTNNNEPKYGNTVGNITNDGMLVESDGWIYYLNADDMYSLYKKRIDNTQNTKLLDDICWFINVVDDWIYYASEYDNLSIYKMRTDGSGRKKMNDIGSTYLNVVDGWIYYLGGASFYPGLAHLYEPYEDWIGIYKMRVDGTQAEKISDDAGLYLNVHNDWLYYSRRLMSEQVYHIYKIRTDGSQRTKVSDDSGDYLNVADGWIYYSNFDDDQKLYKIRTDGTDRRKLNDDRSVLINVIDEWVYYSKCLVLWETHHLGKHPLIRVHTDGSGKQTLVNDVSLNTHSTNDWIYYWDADGNAYRIPR